MRVCGLWWQSQGVSGIDWLNPKPRGVGVVAAVAECRAFLSSKRYRLSVVKRGCGGHHSKSCLSVVKALSFAPSSMDALTLSSLTVTPPPPQMQEMSAQAADAAAASGGGFFDKLFK